MKTDNQAFRLILLNHVNVNNYDEGDWDMEFDPLSYYETDELVAIVRLIDAELQSRNLPTAQEVWEDEGGSGAGVG